MTKSEMLNKKKLIDRVTEYTDIRKAKVREIVELTIAEIEAYFYSNLGGILFRM